MEDLTAEFAKLAPWIYQIRINGVDYGGTIGAAGDVRIEQFFRFAPNVRTILELGALEGAQSFRLADHPGVERVLALEGREANPAQGAIRARKVAGAEGGVRAGEL